MAGFVRLVAEVKCVRLFTCHKCGATARGDTECYSLDVDSPEAIAPGLNAMPLRAHDMPVEWASFYAPKATEFRCPKCK